MQKRIYIFLCVLMAVAITGCSSITPQKNKDPVEEPEKIIIQPEEEPEPTEVPEKEPEKTYSVKDIQVSVNRTGRKGNIKLQLEDSNGSSDISQQFVSSTKSYRSEDENGNGVYMGEEGSMYEKEGEWFESEGSYTDIFSLIYSADCIKDEDTVIDNTPCFHLICDSDEAIGALIAYCHMNEYTEIIEGSTNLNFYINKNTFEIIRVDLSMPFLATAGDGSNEKGELYGTISVSGTSDEQIIKPDTVKKEPEKKDERYTPGEILAESNTYKNQMFSLQIIGKDMFLFDPAKTEEIRSNYESAGSNYQEEAYGSGEGVIINISSIKSLGSSTETILKKYLSDSSAEGIKDEKNVSFVGNQYASMSALINQTNTRSYATGINGRVLIMTLYYTDDSTVVRFEKDHVYNITDNPLWEAGNWILEGKYQITTPNGYSIIQGESGDLFVCMSSSNDEINVFAIEGKNLEDEIASETQTAGNTTREVRKQEEITLNDGSIMNYYVVYNSEPNLNYFTYVGLLQKETAVIKFYAVSTADNADYKKIYAESANSVTVITDTASDGETSSDTAVLEEETTNADSVDSANIQEQQEG